ncbi:hypothetical protein K439DRAFT_1618421 [Ramaria rubella]|nr:hypothetical protein K439DRAFT_1618421 [Ramaria rubella]
MLTSSIALFERFPGEVLTQVALDLVFRDFLGPPGELHTLLLVSKSVYTKLSARTNASLYSSIFQHKFDSRASVARFGVDCAYARRRSDELARRFASLKRLRKIQRSHPTVETLRDDLWTAYVIFLEHEEKNHQQLTQYCEIDKLVFDMLVGVGPFRPVISGERNALVNDHEILALGAWIFWFTDQDRVKTESAESRQCVLIAVVQEFLLASPKHPSTHAPITSFDIPPLVGSPPVPSELLPTSSPYPLASLPASQPIIFQDYFGKTLILTPPLLSPAAWLICVVRLEMAEAEAQVTFPLNMPETREEADSNGWEGPAREDIKEKLRPATRFMEWGPKAGGCAWERYNNDWERLLGCYDPWKELNPRIRRQVFTPGMLAGEWIGKRFLIDRAQYMSHIHTNTAELDAQFPIQSLMMKFSIFEHHQHFQDEMVHFEDISQDGLGDGVFSAWLPREISLDFTEINDLFITTPHGEATIYKTYDPDLASQPSTTEEDSGFYSNGVYDIILTAHTDAAYDAAWGRQSYIGRVRDWDGLIVLVQLPTTRESSVVFSGYVHGGQNLVGRWRESNRVTPVDEPGWEGVWSMSKRERSSLHGDSGYY